MKDINIVNEVAHLKYERRIPDAVIKRLPRYYRYLEDLVNMGISRISSKDLSTRMGITSSQVRQDFFCFGGFGLQGYGYDVEFLHSEIKNILGLNNTYNLIIIGAGHLGQALANHTNFEKRGFRLVGLFDVSPSVIGEKVRDVEILPLDSLASFVENTQVDIAAITVPGAYAREISDILTGLGIKGLWNFAPVELKVPQDVSVENIQLSDSLMVLGYKLKDLKAPGTQVQPNHNQEL